MTTAIKVPLASLAGNTALKVVIGAILEQFPGMTQKQVALASYCSTMTVRRVQNTVVNMDYSDGYIILPLEMLQRMSPLEALLAIEFAELEESFGSAVVSNRKLAAKYQVSVSTIKAAKRQLRKRNYLTQKKRFNKGWQLANKYQVSIQAFGEAFRKAAATIKFFSRKRWLKRVTANKKLNRWIHDSAIAILVASIIEEKRRFKQLLEWEEEEYQRRISRPEFAPETIDLDALLGQYNYQFSAP